MNATLSFPSRESAQAFARAWAFETLRGYSLSPVRPDGSATVSLDGITEPERQWIDSTVAAMNSAAPVSR